MSQHSEDVNEWTSISDLMAALVTIIMLLLVITIIANILKTKRLEEAKQKEMLDYQDSVMKRIELSINIDTNIVEFIKDGSFIRFKGDQSFKANSACVGKELEKTLLDSSFAEEFVKIVNDNWSIQIEGHSDPRRVGVKGNTLDAPFCAYFDDNYSLSAQRAKIVAETILKKIKIQDPEMEEKVRKHISVVGYGPNRLKNAEEPNSSENRRIDIKFIAPGKSAN